MTSLYLLAAGLCAAALLPVLVKMFDPRPWRNWREFWRWTLPKGGLS